MTRDALLDLRLNGAGQCHIDEVIHCSLPLADVDNRLRNVIGRADYLRIGLKISLCRDQRNQLRCDIDIGTFKTAGLHRAKSPSPPTPSKGEPAAKVSLREVLC